MRLLFERLAFTALIVGIILAGYAAYRVVTINSKLDKNVAEQVRRSGGMSDGQITTSDPVFDLRPPLNNLAVVIGRPYRQAEAGVKEQP